MHAFISLYNFPVIYKSEYIHTYTECLDYYIIQETTVKYHVNIHFRVNRHLNIMFIYIHSTGSPDSFINYLL